jgi:hypothetical protein
LRKQFPYQLPVAAVALENRHVKYYIGLNLQLPSFPLQVNVDIQKYMTARYFELKDKKSRYNTLKSSLHNVSDYSPDHIIPVVADSPEQALNIFMENCLNNYNVIIHQREDSQMICEATLPPLFNQLPAGMKYRLQAFPANSNSYYIGAHWIPLSWRHYFEFEKSEATSITDTLQFQPILNRVMQRYAALGLPEVMQFIPTTDKPVQGKLTLIGMTIDSLEFAYLKDFHNILGMITHEKVSYFFPRKVSSKANGFSVSGYLMSHSRMQLWYHLLKIEELYIIKNNTPQLTEINLQLYPFIHSENVLSFFENSE